VSAPAHREFTLVGQGFFLFYVSDLDSAETRGAGAEASRGNFSSPHFQNIAERGGASIGIRQQANICVLKMR
jgi:hypothetical protein